MQWSEWSVFTDVRQHVFSPRNSPSPHIFFILWTLHHEFASNYRKLKIDGAGVWPSSKLTAMMTWEDVLSSVYLCYAKFYRILEARKRLSCNRCSSWSKQSAVVKNRSVQFNSREDECLFGWQVCHLATLTICRACMAVSLLGWQRASVKCYRVSRHRIAFIGGLTSLECLLSLVCAFL